MDESFDSASITATERSEHALGKAMEVASTSPDTGQHGGCTLACCRDAHALSGTTVRVFIVDFPIYENLYFLHTLVRDDIGFGRCISRFGANPNDTSPEGGRGDCDAIC